MRRAATPPPDERGFGSLPDLVATLRGDLRPAFWDGRHCTRAALYARAAAISTSLAEAGVAPGDRVALMARSSADWLAAFLGIAHRGAVAVLIDPRLAASDRDAMIAHADPLLVLADPTLPVPGNLPRAALPLAQAAPVLDEPARVSPAVPAVIVYTSGTSGGPKGVVLSHAALSAQAAAALAMPAAAARFARHICVLPLNFILQLSAALATLAAGGALLFCNSLMPRDILDLQRWRTATSMVAVPRLLESIDRALAVDTAGAAADALQSFAVICGGATLDDGLRLRLAARGFQIYPVYGMTETGPGIAASMPGALRPGSVGRPYPGVEVAIDDASGEILVRGPGVMLGYFRDDAATRAALRGGWLHTGDIGRLDDDGYLTVLGRRNELIVLPNGRKIAPERLETTIATTAALAECCVLAIDGTLTLVAVPSTSVVPSTVVAQRVRAACRALAPHERPAAVHVLTTPLPRTTTGKLQRRAVHALIATATREITP